MDGATKLVGIIGWPVSHSKSPAMHAAAFADLGLNWAYVPLPVCADTTSLQNALKGLAALGFKGVNVTVPHKATVIPFLDSLSPAARAIGAVNTIRVSDMGELVGDNTDAAGFIMDLAEQKIDVNNCRALILGAGGSARAVLYGLLDAGCTHVRLLNRSVDKAHNLIHTIGRSFSRTKIDALEFTEANLATCQDATLIINCTPFGMGEHAGQMLWSEHITFNPNQTVYDLVYNPNPTKVLTKANHDGAKAISGLGMLVHQGALSFEIWTGQKAPVAVMKKVFALE